MQTQTMLDSPMKQLICAAALALTLAAPVRAADLIDYIVAVVNEDVILDSELTQAVDSIERQIRASGNTPPPAVELRDQMRERLILQSIQAQRASQRGIQVSDEELNQALETISQQNGMDLRAFARALRSEGIDFLMVREQVRDELISNRLRSVEVDSRIQVTDREIDTFLAKTRQHDQATEYRLEHILVAVPSGSSDEEKTEAFAEAQQIRQAVTDGASFSQLAISRSDASTALDGGDLGWRSAGALPTVFADQVDNMQVGDVSDIIETGSGYNLIRLTDLRGDQAPQMVTEVHSRHILLQPNAIRDEGTTRQRAHELLEELRGGADFAELAKEHYDDSGSANQGGDLGWQGPGRFVAQDDGRAVALGIDQAAHVYIGGAAGRGAGLRARPPAVFDARMPAGKAGRVDENGSDYEDHPGRRLGEGRAQDQGEAEDEAQPDHRHVNMALVIAQGAGRIAADIFKSPGAQHQQQGAPGQQERPACQWKLGQDRVHETHHYGITSHAHRDQCAHRLQTGASDQRPDEVFQYISRGRAEE